MVYTVDNYPTMIQFTREGKEEALINNDKKLSLIDKTISVKTITYNAVLNDELVIENVETQETTRSTNKILNYWKRLTKKWLFRTTLLGIWK